MKDARVTLSKLLKEQAELREKSAAITQRLAVVDCTVDALRVLLGEAPPKKPRSSQATGTKAVVLDVLADGRRRTLSEVATEAKVEISALRHHMKALVLTGDVKAQGNTHQRTYCIP